MNKSWEERLRETDVIYEERQKDLAQIGISVAETGIKVEKDRFYLVNLNADPSLNELLVYYINKRAVIGSGNDPENEAPESRPVSPEGKVDFVLQGLGVHPRHAQLEIIDDSEQNLLRLYISPLFEGARICVNGSNITEKTVLKNGARLLIGHNHLFRVNCPKDPRDENSLMLASTIMEESQFFDYDKAWLEANSEEQGASISQAVDQYLEQINIKHQVDIEDFKMEMLNIHFRKKNKQLWKGNTKNSSDTFMDWHKRKHLTFVNLYTKNPVLGFKPPPPR